MPVSEVLSQRLPRENEESHVKAVRIESIPAKIAAGHFVNQATPTPSYLFIWFIRAK
jgi:hypothetical protein